MSAKTLTYSPKVEGWTSFYSFIPEQMIGMNNAFYSFKGGNIYKHNVNPLRNNFYGVQYNSRLEFVFNNSSFENKLFQTLILDGDDAWEATIVSDIQDTGYIGSRWFVKKENTWFAFIRNIGQIPADPNEYPLRRVSGIGKSSGVLILPLVTTINFSINPLVSIGDSLSVGDFMYFSVPPYTTPQFAGVVIEINRDLPNGNNFVRIDTTIAGAVPVGLNAYFMFMKDAIAESSGVLGHYAKVSLEVSNASKTELFAVSTEVMKSNP